MYIQLTCINAQIGICERGAGNSVWHLKKKIHALYMRAAEFPTCVREKSAGPTFPGSAFVTNYEDLLHSRNNEMSPYNTDYSSNIVMFQQYTEAMLHFAVYTIYRYIIFVSRFILLECQSFMNIAIHFIKTRSSLILFQ